MSELICKRCGAPALVIYEQQPLCGPCALAALDENQHYMEVRIEDNGPPAEHSTARPRQSV